MINDFTLTILLSTYNGEKYLKAQLDSIFTQTCKDFKIIARDDGSIDNTLEILNSYDIEIMTSSNNLGASGSFSALLEYAVSKENSNYIMFCDQDDIWREDKIEKTLLKMKELEQDTDEAVLVHTDLAVVDEKLDILDKSFWYYQALNPNYKKLSHLTMQNNITGCTSIINQKLAKLALPIPKDAIMHDWWLGMVASAFGKIAYLDGPTILYRQHSSNDTGAKRFDLSFVLSNLKQLRSHSREFGKYIKQAQIFLDRFKDRLDNESIDMLNDFCTIQHRAKLDKIRILFRYKLFKQGVLRNIGLFLSI